MFQLLLLTPLSFSVAAARRNFRDIMLAVHPDRCNSDSAPKVSKFVTHAFTTLTNPTKRYYYTQHGTPSVNEGYNNDEATEVVEQLHVLLSEYRRKQEESCPQQSQNQSDEIHEEVPISIEENSPSLQNGTLSEPIPDTPFEVFLRECRRAASVGVDQTEEVNGPLPGPSGEPDIVEISSDEESRIQVDPSELSFESEVNSVVNSTLHEDNDEPPPYADCAQAGTSANSVPCPSTVFVVDVSTSPIKFEESRTFVDVGTSPFQPGDKVTFYEVPIASTSSSRRNLNSSWCNSPDSSEDRRNSFVPPGSSTPREGSNANNNTSYSSDYTHPSSRANASGFSSSHKKYIIAILSMRTRPEGVRFKVCWGPGRHETIESAETVIQERRGLRSWLELLNVQEPRRYNAILRFHPEFRSVLED